MYMESNMSEQEKRGAGRPAVNNEAIIRDVMAKPETREQFIKQIEKLVRQKRELESKADFYKADVKSTKEAFALSGAFVTTIVDSIVKDNVDKKVKESTLLSDLLSMFAPPEDGEGIDDEADEEFED